MIVAGHQPEFIPYLGFFSKISKADLFVIVDHIQFNKKYFQNRNKIKTREGWMWLTVPVITKGRFEQKIREVEINNSLNWQRKHWASITLNYQKAPFFKEHSGFFEEVYSKEWRLLSEFNEAFIRYILGQLELDVDVLKSSELGVTGQKTDLLIDICKKTGADTYLQGSGGRDYVEVEKFQDAGLKVVFQDFEPPTYPQQFGEFIPNLSIVDLLFNVGPEAKNYLL